MTKPGLVIDETNAVYTCTQEGARAEGRKMNTRFTMRDADVVGRGAAREQAAEGRLGFVPVAPDATTGTREIG
jgi:hypothetical protein